jgi:hypothetical protein
MEVCEKAIDIPPYIPIIDPCNDIPEKRPLDPRLTALITGG